MSPISLDAGMFFRLVPVLLCKCYHNSIPISRVVIGGKTTVLKSYLDLSKQNVAMAAAACCRVIMILLGLAVLNAAVVPLISV